MDFFSSVGSSVCFVKPREAQVCSTLGRQAELPACAVREGPLWLRDLLPAGPSRLRAGRAGGRLVPFLPLLATHRQKPLLRSTFFGLKRWSLSQRFTLGGLSILLADPVAAL